VEFQFIEDMLCEHSLVVQAVVVGSEKTYLSAIIVPNLVELKGVLFMDGHLTLLELEDRKLVENLEARRYFCDIIYSVNKHMVGMKKIERFALLVIELEEQKEELFDHREKLRRIINEKHKNVIDSFYQDIPPGIG
jgi:long-chain acyl-CoA synthetase